MTGHRKTLLLTGASGVLGRALIDALSDEHNIVCLRHRKHIADPRVAEFTGSLDGPSLGLTSGESTRLARQVDLVLHAAATTSWKASPEDIRRTNLEGTRAVVAFSETARVPLYYVSTAFVANPPTPMGGRCTGVMAYIDSKIEAEQLVRAADIPSVIIRPSVIVGDSRNGHMAKFQGLHRIAGMIARGQIPLIACDRGALTDTVPQDVVATAIAQLIRDNVRQGEFWFTAAESAMTAGDVVDCSVELGCRLGLDPQPPRFLPAETVDRLLVPLLEETSTPDMRQMFAELLEFTSLFQLPGALPTSLPEMGLGDQMTRRRLCETFDLSLDYWARCKGLRELSETREASEVTS